MQIASNPEFPAEKTESARKLDSIAWAVFFIWIGIAMLADIPWGWFLVGVGVLILITQFGRRQMSAAVEGFWVVCGAVLLVAGLWNVLTLPWQLAPILLILFGAALLVKAVVGIKR